MNRRNLFGALVASIATLVLPSNRLSAMPMQPLLTKEQWDQVVFGKNASADPIAEITSFVASKSSFGVYLFKNRSGQCIFQIYDPVSGNPCAIEGVFLLSGKPTGVGGWKMPGHLKVASWPGAKIVGIEIYPPGTPKQLRSDLQRAFELLVAA